MLTSSDTKGFLHSGKTQQKGSGVHGTKTTNNRNKMPVIAAVVDEFRALFGDDQVKVTYASEGGIELGARDTSAGISLGNMVIGKVQAEKGKE
jgi:hypothetical protein